MFWFEVFEAVSEPKCQNSFFIKVAKPMRAGRPTRNTKACWISIRDDAPINVYPLDNKGKVQRQMTLEEILGIESKPLPKQTREVNIDVDLIPDFYYFSDQVDADAILDTTTDEQRAQWKKEKEENIRRYNIEKKREERMKRHPEIYAKVEEEDEDESSSEEEYNPHGPSKYFILKDGVAPVDESELDEWVDDEAF